MRAPGAAIVLCVLAAARGADALASDEEQMFAVGALLGALVGVAILLSASLIYARSRRSTAPHAVPHGGAAMLRGRRFAAVEEEGDGGGDDDDDGDDDDGD